MNKIKIIALYLFAFTILANNVVIANNNKYEMQYLQNYLLTKYTYNLFEKQDCYDKIDIYKKPMDIIFEIEEVKQEIDTSITVYVYSGKKSFYRNGKYVYSLHIISKLNYRFSNDGYFFPPAKSRNCFVNFMINKYGYSFATMKHIAELELFITYSWFKDRDKLDYEKIEGGYKFLFKVLNIETNQYEVYEYWIFKNQRLYEHRQLKSTYIWLD